MKNYAGIECDKELKNELEEAGIEIHKLPCLVHGTEPITHILGGVGPWTFRRAWTYWMAEGPGVPPYRAEAFHNKWGREVRVDGHCGCPSPIEWFKGFAVGHYHIDTQEGLKAFADMLKAIYKENDNNN